MVRIMHPRRLEAAHVPMVHVISPVQSTLYTYFPTPSLHPPHDTRPTILHTHLPPPLSKPPIIHIHLRSRPRPSFLHSPVHIPRPTTPIVLGPHSPPLSEPLLVNIAPSLNREHHSRLSRGPVAAPPGETVHGEPRANTKPAAV